MNYDTVSRKAERKTIYLDDAMDAIRKDMYADGDYMSAVICDGIEDVLNSLPPVQPEIVYCVDWFAWQKLWRYKDKRLLFMGRKAGRMNGSKEKKWTDDDLEYAMKKARYSGMLESLRDRRELLVQIRDTIDRELAYVDDRINSAIEAQKTFTDFFKGV